MNPSRTVAKEILFDYRLIARHLQQGLLSEEALATFFSDLPDSSPQAEKMDTEDARPSA